MRILHVRAHACLLCPHALHSVLSFTLLGIALQAQALSLQDGLFLLHAWVRPLFGQWWWWQGGAGACHGRCRSKLGPKQHGIGSRHALRMLYARLRSMFS